jgi:hypothetical protein
MFITFSYSLLVATHSILIDRVSRPLDSLLNFQKRHFDDANWKYFLDWMIDDSACLLD